MKHIHFMQMLLFTPINHMLYSWTRDDDRHAEGLTSFQYWKDIAAVVERGKFDGVFFADTMAFGDDFGEGTSVAMEAALGYPKQDPMAVLPVMLDATRHLGAAVTLSTVGTPPFLAVRRIGTLDNLSRGRVAWNVVNSFVRADSTALGFEQIPHNSRYDYADEYMDICNALWEGFPRDAVLHDRKSKRFVDASKIKRVEYKGKYLSCSGMPTTMPWSDQRPVILQAGQSGRGMEFAVKHADVVFSLHSRIDTMRKYVADVADLAARIGRTAPPPVYFGLQPIIGSTEEEALAKKADYESDVPLKAALLRLSVQFGVDLSKFDVDAPLTADNIQGSVGMFEGILKSRDDDRVPTLREAALRHAISVSMPQCVGTPEQIADRIEWYWRETGCHGFNLSPTTSPTAIVDFVDQVLPILQKRGLARMEYPGTTFRENIGLQ